MKVTTKGEIGFKPFKIEVIIESIDELKELYNRMTVSDDIVNKGMYNDWCDDNTIDLYNTTSELMDKNNITIDLYHTASKLMDQNNLKR